MVDDDCAEPRADESMRFFHWRLLCRVPQLLWRSVDKVVTAVGLFAAVLTALNEEWLALFKAEASAVSPAWGFLPVGLLFLYGLLRANYEERVSLAKGRDRALAKLAEATAKPPSLALGRAELPNYPWPRSLLTYRLRGALLTMWAVVGSFACQL